MPKLRGNDLIVFVKQGEKWKTLAYATACEIDIQAETIDIGSPDTGKWAKKKKRRISWNVSSGHLMSDIGQDVDVYKYLINDEPVRINIASVESHEGQIKPEDYMPDGRYSLTGDALVTRMTITGNRGDFCTLSMSFTGHGELKQRSAIQTYDDYNIVVRLGESIAVINPESKAIEKTVDITNLLTMATDNNEIYALCGSESGYEIGVYDFDLEKTGTITLPGMHTPTSDYVNDSIVVADKKIMFLSPNAGGGIERRMGFVDMKKGREVHYLRESYQGDTLCRRLSYWYDEETGSYYSKDYKGHVFLVRLNEDTYEWEETEYTIFSENPCSQTDRKLHFTNGLGSAIMASPKIDNVFVRSVINNNEAEIRYTINNMETFTDFVPKIKKENEQDESFILVGCTQVEPVLKIAEAYYDDGAVDILAEIPDCYAIYPIEKHPYKNIVLIPFLSTPDVSNPGVYVKIYNIEDNKHTDVRVTGLAGVNINHIQTFTIPKI